MVNIIIAEHLKMKRTFGKIIPLLAPCMILLLALLLTGGMGHAFPAGVWNWWYTFFLPGALAIACYLNIKKDKKNKYYNLLLLAAPEYQTWSGKVIYCTIGLCLSNVMILLGTLTGGAVFGTTIPIWGGMAGAFLLSLAYIRRRVFNSVDEYFIWNRKYICPETIGGGNALLPAGGVYPDHEQRCTLHVPFIFGYAVE